MKKNRYGKIKQIFGRKTKDFFNGAAQLTRVSRMGARTTAHALIPVTVNTKIKPCIVEAAFISSCNTRSIAVTSSIVTCGGIFLHSNVTFRNVLIPLKKNNNKGCFFLVDAQKLLESSILIQFL